MTTNCKQGATRLNSNRNSKKRNFETKKYIKRIKFSCLIQIYKFYKVYIKFYKAYPSQFISLRMYALFSKKGKHPLKVIESY